METFFTCLGFVAIAVLLVPLGLAFAQARKIKALEQAVQKLSARLTSLEARPSAAVGIAEPESEPEREVPIEVPTPPVPAAIPPPLPSVVTESVAHAPETEALPPPIAARPPRAAIDWENFLGVKLFAWIGGFVLFLGVVFLVKYAFDNELITPSMRIIIGALIGSVLVALGWFTSRRNYRVPGQSLCATGVLVLYADIFGAHTYYSLVSLGAAFALMSIITVGAFLLAVTMDAAVVVILGLVGGFLTPLLLTTGEHPAPTFTYIALLNAGIVAVALRKRWDYLFALAALGTIAIETLWIPVHDAARMRAGFPIFLGLQLEFLVMAFLRQRNQPNEKWSAWSAAAVGFASVLFGFALLDENALATSPGFFFGFTFLADVGLLAVAILRPNPARIAALAGSAVFALLAAWTATYLRHDLLWWTLGAALLFALLHAGFSVWPERERPEAKRSTGVDWQNYVPLLALALLVICVWRGETSFALWAIVLLVDVVAIGLAVISRSVVTLLIALVVTLVAAGLWVVTAPPLETSVIGILIVIGSFGVFFSTAASFLARKLGFTSADPRSNVPAIAAAMPFVLLLMVVAKLPIGAPTAVFAVALLLAIVLLGLGILARTSWIAAVALAFTWAVEREWHTLHFSNSFALLALGWYVAFFLVFTAYPFFARATAEAAIERVLPWAIGAFSGVLHFWLIYEVVTSAYPNLRNGLLPAVFILPYALGLFRLVRQRGIPPASGDARLAWQGGAALFYLSLIFPIQFEREWITLGWAVEGFALLALFRSVPNAGLRSVGAGLLSVAFVRLALNPAVLEYHRRTPIRIWNWYLYAYGLTSLCLFGGARLVHRYRDTQLARLVPRLLYTLGVILTFLLLNIEVADYFSVGPTLTFSFSGNFARDMTYSIAWALFAFALLIVGMKKELRYARYAALALLLVTLLKLFLHDLSNLTPLYRIGAFMGVALVLIIASFAYQRFLAPAQKR